jgi:purine-binding chemotaxis protein CheW
MGAGADTSDAGAQRSAILDALRANEREHLRLRAGLVALGAGQRLPGLYLAVAAAGGRLLVPAARIAEVALRVALDPVPGSPAWLPGSFLWRGRPALAVDLGARLGAAPCRGKDALLVILDGEPPVALLVDAVLGLVEDPLLSDTRDDGRPSGRLFLGACALEAEAVEVLAPEVVEQDVRGAA